MRRVLTLFKCCLAIVLMAGGGVTQAAPVIFACEPEWAALAKALTGGQVEIYTATHAAQDPHFIEARPSLMAAARRASLLVCTGAELEAGWLPLLLRESANNQIQPGAAGHFMASDHVSLLDVPVTVDRSEGDVHASGNPHLHLDPDNVARVARALAATLREVFPALADDVNLRERAFLQQWQQASDRWQAKAGALKGVPVFVQHANTRYLTHWLQLRVVGALEPKPGVPPSAGHLARVLAQHRQTPAVMVLVAAYESPKPAQWLRAQTGIPVVVVPYTVGGGATTDLFDLMEATLDGMLAVVTRDARS